MVSQTCQIFSMPLGFSVYCSLCLKCHFPLLFQFHNTARDQLLEESFPGWVRCRCCFPQLRRFLPSQHSLCAVLPIDLYISASSLVMSVGECSLRVCIVSSGDFCTPHTCGFSTFPMLCSSLRLGCGSPIPRLSCNSLLAQLCSAGQQKGLGIIPQGRDV